MSSSSEKVFQKRRAIDDLRVTIEGLEAKILAGCPNMASHEIQTVKRDLKRSREKLTKLIKEKS